MRLFAKFINFFKRFFSSKNKVTKIIHNAMEWVGNHPEHFKLILDLAASIKRGDLHKMGAKLIETNDNLEAVKVQLEDGQIVEVPLKYVDRFNPIETKTNF